MRQVCFSLFVLVTGSLLYHRVPRVSGVFLESRRYSVPVLLYAAAELFCYGRNASVLLPIRMLMLVYGVCLYMGLAALVLLIHCDRFRAAAAACVFPFTVLEAALLGYVLLRDGYCRSRHAAWLGTIGMLAAVFLWLLITQTVRQRTSSAR